MKQKLNRANYQHDDKLTGGGRRRNNVAMDIFDTRHGTHVLQSLDGFGFALSNDGRFLYISETVSIYLGLSQVEMTGSSIFDYTHQADHPELSEQLGLSLPQCNSAPGSPTDDVTSTSRPRSTTPPGERGYVMNPNPSKGPDRSFCIRMKSTLTKRGVHSKSQGYRVVHILGRMRHQMSFTVNRKQSPTLMGMVAIAIALPPPTITELRIDNDTFITRMTPDFKLVYCEPIICELMDISSEDMTNRLIYDFCHAADLHKLRKAHVDLLAKGQVLSDYYRLTNKNGGYIWIQTCATTIYSSKNSDEQSIVAINYVLSGVENEEIILDMWQLPGSSNLGTDQSDHSDQSELGSQLDSTSPKLEPSISQNSKDEDMMSSTNNNVCHEDKDENTKDRNDNETKDLGQEVIIYGEKSDVKNSRRKMDKPRKRKRDDFSVDLNDSESDKKLRNCYSFSESADVMCGTIDSNGNHVVSGPQDLTSKSDLIHNHDKDWTVVSTSQTGETTPSSVKDLEVAMNRHLPASKDSKSDSHLYTGQSSKKSTIQWAGSNSHNGAETLPATNFLRSLYANRESVIRCNTRPTYYNDMSTNILTPPSSEHYKEQHPFCVTGLSKPSLNGHYSNMATYTTSSLSVSMPTAIETFGMTPPSSVSPHEKHQSSFGEPGNFTENCNGISHHALKQPYHLSSLTASPLEYSGVKPAYFPAISSTYPGVEDYNADGNHETVSAINSYEPCSRSVLPWYPVSFSS